MGTKNNDETKSTIKTEKYIKKEKLIDQKTLDTAGSSLSVKSAELGVKSAMIKTEKSIKKEKIDCTTLDTVSLSVESTGLVTKCDIKKKELILKKEKRDDKTFDTYLFSVEESAKLLRDSAIKTEESIKKETKDQISLDSLSLSLKSLGISNTSADGSKNDLFPRDSAEERKLKKSVTDGKDSAASVHDIISHRVVRKRKLLVLNLNGVLVDVVFGFIPCADAVINNRSVFTRPFCKDFLKFCFEKFDVGIWSSRMSHNMVGVVDTILGDLKKQLLFSWDQSYCTDTGLTPSQIGLMTPNNTTKPLFLMELKKIWNKYEEYNESNTLLLDDTPYKSLLNPPHTAIFPEPYIYQLQNDCALAPRSAIRLYLEGVAMAENVPNYVGQHPFGRTPMTLSREICNKLIRK
ncbi:hypothetical protein IFM89_032995 [Coptis chinensis]|uniref:Mitochondrial import inner membrane translocase subunit TIM50 n=1 Tax=Coptis chinensis TaxID=261450 RepID=A0A835IDI6_9MAGN|nr:hypothetical protein IFM89_032995 [Coptis chinensis]